jgi:hypothetical protein
MATGMRLRSGAIVSTSTSNLSVATKSIRKSAPIEKLLNVFELCEQVLDYLPMYDVIHAVQACRAFKSNVENSSRLQMKLFLAPDLTRRTRSAISSERTLLFGVKAAQHIAAAEAAGLDHTGELVFYTPHPVINLHAKSGFVKRMGLVRFAFQRVLISHDGGVLWGSVGSSSTDMWFQGSSLENMFLTQPPNKRVTIVGDIHPNSRLRTAVVKETGVTFGDVCKAIRAKSDPDDHLLKVTLGFQDGIVASARTRELAESVDELSVEADPTCWVLKDREFVPKEGGFAF